MARGCISNNGTALLVLLLGLVSLTNVVRGTEWVVGDDDGWSPHIENNWPGGRPIKAGDVLVFKYTAGKHNVVVVNEAEYRLCYPTNKFANSYMSGNDHIKIPQGTSYFICTFPGQCTINGMKIAVTAQ